MGEIGECAMDDFNDRYILTTEMIKNTTGKCLFQLQSAIRFSTYKGYISIGII